MALSKISSRIIKAIAALAGVAIIGLLGAVTYGFLAKTKVNYTVAGDWTTACSTDMTAQSSFLGLAFSGGGSRAAIFAAAGAVALGDAGILEQVTHISSVSGGGFTASYLATHRNPQCVPALNGEAPQNCLVADMAQMRPALTQNYFRAMEWRQVTQPARAFSPSRRVTSLQQALEDGFLGATQFNALPAHPVFLFNGVSYDSGDRFVMSNGVFPHRSAEPATQFDENLRMLTFSEPNCARTTPGNMPLSLAVVMSAAFPPLLGPVTIEVPEDVSGRLTEFWHLGDGGVIDNTGLDTLLDAALSVAAGNPEMTDVQMISFNAGLQVDEVLSRATHDLSIWSSMELSRLVDIPNLRANRFRDLYVSQLIEGSDLRINVIEFNYLDAIISWHPSCSQSEQTPQPDVREFLASIPTGLSITTCGAAMIEAAAAALVEEALGPDGALKSLARNPL